MSGAKSLLGVSFSAPTFRSSGEKCFSAQAIRTLDMRVNTLTELADKIGVAATDLRDESGIPIVFRKFKAAVGSPQELRLKNREVRTLAHALDYSEKGLTAILGATPELERALRIITLQWKDGFITALLGCYLKNWNASPETSQRLLYQTISGRLRDYAGKRPAYLAMKAGSRYFMPSNGDLLLGSDLAIKNVSIATAAKCIALPESWMMYPYFHGVILTFYEKNSGKLTRILPDIEAALRLHAANTKGSWTSLLLISKLIGEANMPDRAGLQEQVKLLAFSLVGDPAVVANWTAPSGKAAHETKLIEQARQILNEWITRQFITVFFETCLDDTRRKAFWLSMAKRVSAFKVFGSQSVRAALKRDERVKDFVDNRYQVSGGSTNVAAILMHVGEYALVEFSDTGWAFYAYRIGSKYCPRMDEYYHNIGELRNTGLPRLLYRQGRQMGNLSDEGSLNHHPKGEISWEEVFRYWISQKIGNA